MKLKKYLFIALILITTSGLQAQKVLTLDECIKIAMDNNIDLKRARNNSLIAASNQFQALMNFLPTLNGAVDYTYRFQSGIDNVTGTFFSQIETSSPTLFSNVTLFNGFANHYNLKANINNRVSAENGLNEQKQNIKSSVLGSYLNVVLNKENIKISNDRIKLLETQLDREVKRESVGVGNMEQVFNFKSQLANENLNLVNFSNSLQSNMLALLQVLQLDLSDQYDVAPFDFDESQITNVNQSFEKTLSESEQYSPSLKRAQANSLSAKYNFKATQATMFPTLSAFVNYGSRFSSINSEEEVEGLDTLQRFVPYFDQAKQTKFQSAGFQLNIPIFNNWRRRSASQVAKLNMYNAELDLQQTQQNVTNNVQRVYLDLLAAQSTHKAAKENLIALNQSFDFVKTRYDNGNTDFYTYLESLNNKNRAELELVNAKYGIVFRKKILDVFKGTF